MKTILICYSFLALAVGSFAESAMKGPTPEEEVAAFNSFPRGPDKEDDIIAIQIVSYSGTNPADPKNRLFIANGQAFRTVEDLKREILRAGPKNRQYWILYGNDAMPAPNATFEEITDLVTSCRKAKIAFHYEKGG